MQLVGHGALGRCLLDARATGWEGVPARQGATLFSVADRRTWLPRVPRLGLARRAGFEKQFFSFCFGFQVFVLFILFFYFCCLMEGKLTLVIDHWTDRDPVENS